MIPLIPVILAGARNDQHDRNPQNRLSAVGWLFVDPQWGALPGKEAVREAGQEAQPTEHRHRAEHWVVVSGTAEVTIDGRVTIPSENESIYLALGCVHRLANPGKILFELIEVQTGSYLGEDDIIQIEGEFGRT